MLSKEEIKSLRAQSHQLKPVVTVGVKGLTDAVLNEIEIALDYHELIKVKMVADRDSRAEIARNICTATQATLVNSIGQIGVFYRQNPEKR